METNNLLGKIVDATASGFSQFSNSGAKNFLYGAGMVLLAHIEELTRFGESVYQSFSNDERRKN